MLSIAPKISHVAKAAIVATAPFAPPGAPVVPFMSANDSAGRTSTASMPMDSRREITRFSRHQLIKKSRWLFNNFGLFRRLVNGVVRYSVGAGIVHIPLTENAEFNMVLSAYFDDWADNRVLCDVRRKLNFWRMQRSICRAVQRDGEAFALKAPSADEDLPDGTSILGRPRIQWLETQSVDNIENSWNISGTDKQGFTEGIKLDPYGAADQYRVIQDNGEPMIVDWSDINHIYDPERATQVHGLPWGHSGANSAIDMLDITALEKHLMKVHGAVGGTITSEAPTVVGGPGSVGGDIIAQYIAQQHNTNSKEVQRPVYAYEQFMTGGAILKLGLNEKFQFLSSDRDSQTFGGFLDYFARDITAGYGTGLHEGFFFAMGNPNGPNTRLILEDSAWFFAEVQDLMTEMFCQPEYMWVIARGIMRGEIIVPDDVTNPFACAWQGPAKVTIDQGNEGSLELERLKHGCATWEEYWSKRGKSGKTMVRARIDEIADAMAYAKEKGVPFDYIMPLNQGGVGGPAEGNKPKLELVEGKPKPGTSKALYDTLAKGKSLRTEDDDLDAMEDAA